MAEAEPAYSLSSLGSVLVTGGCGFLGSHIVSLLLAQSKSPSTKIHVLDVRPPTAALTNATYHTADITSVESTRSILESIKPNVIIHTVSPVFKSGGGQKAKDFTWKVNVEGTRILMEEAKRVGTRAFVFTSSASVISDQRSDLINADERWELVRGSAQNEYYADTKAEAESVVLATSSRVPGRLGRAFLTTAIRPSAMFGELDVQMVPNMLATLRQGRSNFQLGENDNLFDFTYVGNVAHAHLLAADKLLKLAKGIEAMTVGEVAKQQTIESRATGTDAAENTGSDEANKVDGEAFIITNLSPVYFWDFARALWSAYYLVRPTPKPPATKQQVYTLSRGFSLFISIVMTFVMSLFGKKPTLQPSSVRFACMTRYFRTRKAETCLGYFPPFTLEEGIARTVKWFAEREAEDAGSEGKKDR